MLTWERNLIEKILSLIDGPLEHKGYGVSFINIVKRPHKKGTYKSVLIVDIDRLDKQPVGIDDCVEANRIISAILDVEDLIKEAYTLEVSSPGDERHLLKIEDFERFCDEEATVWLHSPYEGQKKICGKILKVDIKGDASIVYLKEECNNKELSFNILYSNIKKAIVKRNF